MQELLSTFQWGPVSLALIPLALALGVFIFERLQDSEPPATGSGQPSTTM